MEFRKVLALRGPNVWASFPVLEAWLDLGALKESSSDELPGFNDRLKAWLPGLVEHHCSVGTRGGFFERLRRGTYQGHVLEHVALELQSLAGTEVGYGRTRAASEDGVYKVVVEYEEEELGRAALEAGLRLCLAAVLDRPFDVEGEVGKLRALARRVVPGTSLAALLAAAKARAIPVRRFPAGGLIQLGHGAKARRLLGTQTDHVGALAASIAEDAELTRNLLHAAGVPVPEGRLVSSAEDAWAAAEELGLPVVVKPRYDERRRAVGRRLTTREQVLDAFQAASDVSSSILVERFVPGADYRLLVVDSQVVAAVRRENGQHGGADVTEEVHPEVAARAVEAAWAVGLTVAGIDVAVEDLSRPLEEQGGAVVRVRANPGLRLHLKPTAGAPRLVAEAVIDSLFPGNETGRVPVAAVTGVNGKTTTTRLLAHLVGRTGRTVGMTCTEGIYVAGRRIEVGDCSGPKSARGVLANPKVEAAVFEVARGGILREGLGFDWCNVGVVTNLGEGDHLGANGIETIEQLACVKCTVVEAVAPTGAAVLNAADPLVVEMAEYCRGSVVYFALDVNAPVVRGHRAGGGRAAFVHDDHLVLAEGGQEIPLVPLRLVPLTHGGCIGFQIENVLAATAAAWCLGVPCEQIRAGLETFRGGLDQTPGRFNLLEVGGATVVMDYGHNVTSLTRLLEVLAQFPPSKRTAVYTAAGDRRDEDLIRQAKLLGDAFDRVILYEDPNCVRGRHPGEIMAVFRKGLAHGKRVEEIRQVQGAVKAIEVALGLVGPGELLLGQVDVVDETVEFVRHYLAAAAGREVHLGEVLADGRYPETTFTCTVDDASLASPE
jgi:cyanophycin synthetase